MKSLQSTTPRDAHALLRQDEARAEQMMAVRGAVALDIQAGAPRGQTAKLRAILNAALDVFCEDGVAGASIDAIAFRAGVSRQTVYNQMGDKEKLFGAVIKDITGRTTQRLFAVLGSFPDAPTDLEADLVAFGMRLTGGCMCDRDAKALARLMENEGTRYPDLFATWKDYGPGRGWPAIAARFAKLAHDGHLELDDPSLAARQFLALINADLPPMAAICASPGEAEVRSAVKNAVRTFLRAFGPRTMRV